MNQCATVKIVSSSRTEADRGTVREPYRFNCGSAAIRTRAESVTRFLCQFIIDDSSPQSAVKDTSSRSNRRLATAQSLRGRGLRSSIIGKWRKREVRRAAAPSKTSRSHERHVRAQRKRCHAKRRTPASFGATQREEHCSLRFQCAAAACRSRSRNSRRCCCIRINFTPRKF